MSEHLKFPNALPAGHIIGGYKISRAFDEDDFSISYLAINTEQGINQDINESTNENINENINESIDNKTNKTNKGTNSVIIKEYLPKQFALRDRTSNSVILKGPNCKYNYEWGLSHYHDEATELVALKHPNIINIQACISANNTAYMVTDYVKGLNLETYSKNIRPTETEIITLLEPLLSGLQCIHESGYLHSDLSPSNILIEDGSEKPVIINLGSAKNIFRSKGKNISQTLAAGYASHEQYYANGKLGIWTDIYAIGAIAYRLTIGGPPPMPSIIRLSTIVDQNEMDPLISAATLGAGRYSNPFLQAIDHAMKLPINERPQSIYAWEEELGISHEASVEASIEESLDDEIGGGLTISGISDPDDNPSSPANMDFDSLKQPISMGENLSKNSSRYGVMIATILGMVAVIAGATYAYTHYIDKPQTAKNAYQATDKEEKYSDSYINQLMGAPDSTNERPYTEKEVDMIPPSTNQKIDKSELEEKKINSVPETKKQDTNKPKQEKPSKRIKKRKKKENKRVKKKPLDPKEAKDIKTLLLENQQESSK